MKKINKLLISLLACGVLFGCMNKNVKTPEQIKVDLQKQIPGLPADVIIGKSQVSGLYEVVVGRKVFYVTEDGKYLMFGNLIQLADKKNLTDSRIQELSKVDWNKLPLDLAIKEVNGTGKNKLVIFSDPDCPYCQLFEKQVVPNLKDTTIYVFLFPLPNHPDARLHSEQIWCSSDKSVAWKSWMRDKKMVSTNVDCDKSKIDESIKVGTELVQMNATPTLILENGQMVEGGKSAEELIPMMEQASAKK
jgi:thiol:disulfide interchange protein DsbC